MEKEAAVVTNADVMVFYNGKKEHYPYTDKFIVACEFGQQKGGEYIGFANKTGHIVYKSFAEPNQKWHFLESYCIDRIKDKGIGWLEKEPQLWDPKWGLKCPELLLWLVEASGIDTQRVSDLCDALIKTCTTNEARISKGTNLIKDTVQWEEIAAIILGEKQKENK